MWCKILLSTTCEYAYSRDVKFSAPKRTNVLFGGGVQIAAPKILHTWKEGPGSNPVSPNNPIFHLQWIDSLPSGCWLAPGGRFLVESWGRKPRKQPRFFGGGGRGGGEGSWNISTWKILEVFEMKIPSKCWVLRKKLQNIPCCWNISHMIQEFFWT